MLQALTALPYDVICLILEKIGGEGKDLHGARRSCKLLCSLVDKHTSHLRIRLQPTDSAESQLCSRFWNDGGLSKWPRRHSVTLVWDAVEVRHGELEGPLLLPFARAPLEARQRVRQLTVSARFYGKAYFIDAESSDSASADEDEDDGEGSDGEERDGEEVAEAGKELEAKEEEAGKEGKAGEEGLMAGGAGVMEEGGSESEAGEEEEAEGEGEELEAEAAAEEAASDDEEDGSIGTMQLPAQSLAALLRLLPNLHTVDLPPSSPYADPDDGELVCSALAKLPNLSDLTISSITLADQLGPLSGLQHLTRLVVGTLDPISDVQGAGHYWADEMEADGVEAICGLSGLRHLELRPWRVMQVWDAMLADMLHALPHLEHVTVRGVSAMEWHDDSGGHGFLGHHNTLSLDLASGSITAIDIETSSFCETSPNAARAVSLGLLAHFCKTMLLPCVAPASAPTVKRLRLRCSLALSDADPDPAGEWAAPLRELVGRCAAVEVESMDLSLEAAGRRVAAAEVEALVRLLGVPERICLGRHTPCSQRHWVQLRRPGEAGALGCGGGGGGGEGVPAPAPARDVPEGALKHLRYEDLAQALQALWDDGAAGTELQRLRRMLVAVTVPPRPQPQPAPQHLMHPFMPEDW